MKLSTIPCRRVNKGFFINLIMRHCSHSLVDCDGINSQLFVRTAFLFGQRNIPFTITSTASSGVRPCAMRVSIWPLSTLPMAASWVTFGKCLPYLDREAFGERAFSRAVRAEQGMRLRGADRHREIVEYFFRPAVKPSPLISRRAIGCSVCGNRFVSCCLLRLRENDEIMLDYSIPSRGPGHVGS
jgi:hypothetical protein